MPTSACVKARPAVALVFQRTHPLLLMIFTEPAQLEFYSARFQERAVLAWLGQFE